MREEFKGNVAFKLLQKCIGGAVQWAVFRNMALEHKRKVKAVDKSMVFEAMRLDVNS